jgi:tripartite-type tricarboxylate transporter receptor subunit TctC
LLKRFNKDANGKGVNFMKKSILLIAILFGILALVGCSSDKTAAFPDKNKTIKLIVPKDPGGGTDIVARGLVEFAKDDIDSDIIVENLPGAGGVTGMLEGSNAKADGYTLTMTTVELAILPHLGQSPITYEKFTPIVTPIADPASVIVPADAPYDTIEEFIEYAKANPGLKVGNSGVGSIWHLAAVALENEFDLEFNHIPFDGGSAPAVAELVGGHLDAITVAPGNAKAQIDAGELKVLAVMGAERLESFADVPTFKEELDMDFNVRAWATLVVPSETPKEVVDKLSEIFVGAAKDPEFKEYLLNQGIAPVELGPEESQKMMEEDHKLYESLVEEIGLKQ